MPPRSLAWLVALLLFSTTGCALLSTLQGGHERSSLSREPLNGDVLELDVRISPERITELLRGPAFEVGFQAPLELWRRRRERGR